MFYALVYGACVVYLVALLLFHHSMSPVLFSVGVDLWALYLRGLTARPLVAKMCISMCGFTAGDTVAQLSSLSSTSRFDRRRTAKFASWGGLLHGPMCHFFFSFVDRTVLPQAPKSLKAVAIKLALDRLCFAPVLLCVMYIWLTFLEEGCDLTRIRAVLQQKLLKTWLTSNLVWVAAHAVNFRFVPRQQRVLFVNVVSVCWNVILCSISGAGSVQRMSQEPRHKRLI